MLNKSIKLKNSDAAYLSAILASDDPRVHNRGTSEVLHIIFDEAAQNTPNWKKVLKRGNELENSEAEDSMTGETKTFLVSEENYNAVYESVSKQLQLQKPRGSYLTRLALLSFRLLLLDNQENSSMVSTDPQSLSEAEFSKLGVDDKLDVLFSLLKDQSNHLSVEKDNRKKTITITLDE